MRCTVASFALAAVVLAGSAGAFAKETPHQTSGAIKRIDAAGKTLVIEQEGRSADSTFVLANDAKITAGTRATTLSQLKVGERVEVSYTGEGTRHVAQRVEVIAARTAAAKPASKPMSR